MRVLIPQPGDRTLCEECGYPVVAFEHRGLIHWRHLHDLSERHGYHRIKKDPRAWIVRG